MMVFIFLKKKSSTPKNYYYTERLCFWIYFIIKITTKRCLNLGITFMDGKRSNHYTTMPLEFVDELIVEVPL